MKTKSLLKILSNYLLNILSTYRMTLDVWLLEEIRHHVMC